MTSLIAHVIRALDSLESAMENTVGSASTHDPRYDVKRLMRVPNRNDRTPALFIIPTGVTPEYLVMSKILENGYLSVRLMVVIKKPFDDDGTTLLNDLDLIMQKLFSIRFEKSYWTSLDYETGVTIKAAEVDNWIFQSADIYIRIKVN